MAHPPDQYDKVKGIARSIAGHPMDRYLRADLSDALGFKAVQQYTELLWKLFDVIARADLSSIPDVMLDPWISRLDSAANALIQIRDFSVEEGGDIGVRRNGIINNVRNQCTDAFSMVAPLLSLALLSSAGIASVVDDLRKQAGIANAQATAHLDAAKKIEEQVATESKAILAKARGAAEHVALATHAKFFAEQAALHKSYANRWMGVTLLFGVAVGWFALYVFNEESPSSSAGATYLIAHLSHTGLITAALLFGLVWSARNYRSNMHNWIVNSHRRNVLNTYPALSTAVKDDPEARRAVLLKSTEAIFAHMPTGFMPAGDDEAPAAMQMMEVIKSGKPE